MSRSSCSSCCRSPLPSAFMPYTSSSGARKPSRLQPTHPSTQRGPLVLAGVVSLALFSIFVISVKDLVDTMSARGETAAHLLSLIHI